MAGRARTTGSRARQEIRELAARRGWNPSHPAHGGDLLEKDEISSFFPGIGLGPEAPDFLFCPGGNPVMVAEATNEAARSGTAIEEAIRYAESINAAQKYSVTLAAGASGSEEHGFIVHARVRSSTGEWVPLLAGGCELTTLPSRAEAESACTAGDGTTRVEMPAHAEFIDAAIEMSRILRSAKVEPVHRPKVLGALVLAMYQDAAAPAGSRSAAPALTLDRVNQLVTAAVHRTDGLTSERRAELAEALRLTGAGYRHLDARAGRLLAILRRLNVRAVMHRGVDFLGTFYEAFLRYGYDNNSLGIVFTPRHITRFCADLLDVDRDDRVVDLACGTGGFLVSAFDRMLRTAPGEADGDKIRGSLAGYDTNPTVWALAVLNMYFRGDGKSHIVRASSLTTGARAAVRQRFTKAFLNPPFSQDDEPERQFIDASMDACEPGGLLAAVVKAGIFADGEHTAWRAGFTRRHAVQAVISLPEDLFYPTAAPTSILIGRAHVPQRDSDQVYLARVSNDGFTKLKGKRVERPGSELADVVAGYRKVQAGSAVTDDRSVTVPGSALLGGAEWSPQEWLPQPPAESTVMEHQRAVLAGSLLRTVARYPELSEQVVTDLDRGRDPAPLPYGSGLLPLSGLFEVQNGRSSGEKNYLEGDVAYVSSGDLSNSIVGLVHPVPGELFCPGAITVTAFGQAFVQPWPFMARGNGGSSVRVLVPRFRMSFRELLWFAAQVNLQRWRFFYARMAIKSRIVRLHVEVPAAAIPDEATGFGASISGFLDSFQRQRRTISGVG